MSESGREAGALRRADSHAARSNTSDRIRSSDESVAGVGVHKVCCVCGEMLNHKTRFKDSQGRYWCASCNEEDHRKVRPVPCVDCGNEMPRMVMKEVRGLLFCPVCVGKLMTESKVVAESRIRALAHGPHAKPVPKRQGPVFQIVIALLLLMAAIALALYRLA